MKTFKSIQKNQAQLNSLLMEKWGYKNEVLEEGPGPDTTWDEPPKPKPEPKPEPVPVPEPDLPTKEKDDLDEALEEGHNCKSAHPGMNHDQWAGKHR
jgi:hypothetical protein